MKNILLATTALVMTAGMASAEVTFTGTTKAGVTTDTGVATVYTYGKLGVAGTTTTDGGLTVSLSQSIESGSTVSLSTTTGDGGWAIDTNAGALSQPVLTVSGGFGTLTINNDGVDDYITSSDDHDAGLVVTLGAATVSLATTISDSNADNEVGDYSAKVVIAAGDFTITAAADEDNNTKGVVSYAMGDSTVGLTSKTVSDLQTNSAQLAWSSNGLSVGVSTVLSTDSTIFDAGDYDLSLGYSLDATSIALGMNEDGDYNLVTSYDLGGGASIRAGANSSEFSYLGLQMSF